MTAATPEITTTFLSRAQAAEYLNMSAKFLATNLKTGPSFHRFGVRVRYSVTELDNWARQQLVAA